MASRIPESIDQGQARAAHNMVVENHATNNLEILTSWTADTGNPARYITTIYFLRWNDDFPGTVRRDHVGSAGCDKAKPLQHRIIDYSQGCPRMPMLHHVSKCRCISTPPDLRAHRCFLALLQCLFECILVTYRVGFLQASCSSVHHTRLLDGDYGFYGIVLD